MSRRVYLRHLWSHRGGVHRGVVRTANGVLRRVPFGVKYGVGHVFSKRSPPYNLLSEGDVAVQIGAPRDTLHSGRSRAMYFALCVGRTGKVVVLEPDPDSAAALRAIARRRGLDQLEILETGAWKEPGTLTLHIDPEHPATNFTENTAGYSEEDMARFQAIEMPVDTVDGVLERLGVGAPRIVSITTNGAERQIVEGMKTTLDQGVPYLAMARTDPEHEAWVTDNLGYHRIAYDDRGFTFAKTS